MTARRFAITTAALLASLLCSPSVSAQHIIHVDDNAPLGGDGTTWSTAYKYLQDALAVAIAGDEIRVAGGTYKPDQDESGDITPGDREARFQLIGGVSLVGGFAGLAGPTSPNTRRIAFYESVLTGDLAGDDGTDFANNGENSFNILTARDIDLAATVDGFTITAGNAHGDTYYQKLGGGLFALHSTVWFANCVFSENSGRGSAAAHLEYSPGSLFDHCVFRDNVAVVTDIGGAKAGAMGISQSDPVLTDCAFVENRTVQDLHGGQGGAVHTWNATPRFEGCVFSGNTSGEGGAIDDNGSSPVLVNCLFAGNVAWDGGAILIGANATITNCTFSRNHATLRGGGLTFYGRGNPWIQNCIFWQNTDETGSGELAQIHERGDAAPTVLYSCISGLNIYSGYGNIGDDPLFVDELGPDGVAGTGDEDLRLLPGSPCIGAGNHMADIDINTSGYQPLPETDLAGHPRILCDWVDMGAYEFGMGDYNCNQSVDLTDFTSWPTCMTGPSGGPYGLGCNAFDFVYNLDVDLEDFAGFQSVIYVGTATKLPLPASISLPH